ncbi:two-component sensor histidine kinase [Virgisporangium aliadipatigenens]|uniref:histidine kinase n=1 Tax=Virgisporangium aliadipatigenens TaxID=741659 RepID=A0A8J4DN88_9ACTN|nr:histidine kinase [Virgisporangium aliadipatigenens]GIJ43318.1 two-component sensor histidine kinase [Virgisporangium aliadipatigenens]
MEQRLARMLPVAVAGVAVFALSFLAPGKPASFYDEPALDAVYGPGALVLAGVLAASCGIATMLARRWWWPLCVAALAAWLTFGSWPGMMAATYHSVVRGRRVPAAVLAGVVFVAHVAGAVYTKRDFRWAYVLWAVIAAAMLVALPSAVGLWMAARRQVLAAARERAAQLEREHSARTDQARAEERARIAREMHDVVAHRVSLMVLHAGALEVNTSDPATAEAAALIRTTGREALADLRSVLGVLRPAEVGAAPQPTLADLDALLDESRAAGVTVVRRDCGAPRAVSPSVERTTYRIVREALTNVHKHAGRAAADVELRYGDDALEVSVRNGPSDGGAALLPGSGMGLAGLRERVELLGGEFFAGPQVDGGFKVRALLPLGAV